MKTNDPNDNATNCINCGEYKNRADSAMRDWEERIAELKEKGRDLTSEAQRELDEMLATLETSKASFGSYLTKLTEQAELAWDDVKDEAEDKWAQLSHAVQKAIARYS